MMEQSSPARPDLIGMTGDLVAAYVSNNHVAYTDLPMLIGGVYTAIIELVAGVTTSARADEPVEKPSSVQVRRSVGHDGIISLIDGRKYQTLKRHLTSHGLTPERYRERYGLPRDYPMVCRSYSERRSSLAKAIGLGVPGARVEKGEERSKNRRKAA